jgi:hypothetical protein
MVQDIDTNPLISLKNTVVDNIDMIGRVLAHEENQIIFM